jgi:hypothetical protein
MRMGSTARRIVLPLLASAVVRCGPQHGDHLAGRSVVNARAECGLPCTRRLPATIRRTKFSVRRPATDVDQDATRTARVARACCFA